MDINILKNFNVFSSLTHEELTKFNDVTKEINIAIGDNFITEGEVGDSLFFLIDGEVEINQALTMPMGKTDLDNREKAIIKLTSDIHPMFGEMSLFNHDDRRTANVKALTACKLAKIMKDDLFAILNENPETGYKILSKMCGVLCNNLVKANRNVLKLTTAFSLVLER